MEALLLLELCLDQKWLKPWYRPAQQKMQSAWHLLRLSTPAAVALRLFALDRAILYDKVRVRGGEGGYVCLRGHHIRACQFMSVLDVTIASVCCRFSVEVYEMTVRPCHNQTQHTQY